MTHSTGRRTLAAANSDTGTGAIDAEGDLNTYARRLRDAMALLPADRTAERDACAFAAEVLEDLAAPVIPAVPLDGRY